MAEPTPPPHCGSVRVRHYDPALGNRIEILLDGQRQQRVIAYDCVAGTVLRYVTDGDGRIQIGHGRALEETVNGTVEVRWKKGREHG